MKTMSRPLIVTALIGGMIGCLGVEYGLFITGTAGGSVTVPGEKTYGCDAGTVVALMAQVHDSYRLMEWTGHVSTIGDINAATTNITVNRDWSMVANFAVRPSMGYS